MTPEQLLEQARHLCDDTEWSRAFWATRAATILARQAMEAWLAEYWAATAPAVLAVQSARARFLLLHARLGPGAAAQAFAIWSRLSEACHHHPHELPPSRHDVLAWIQGADAFAQALRADVTRGVRET